MPMLRRLHLLVGSALVAAILVACGATVAPTTRPAPTVTAAAGPGDLQAYTDAICPIFGRILGIDRRLVGLRAAGESGGDVSDQSAEIEAVSGELGAVLADLEAVPNWNKGQRLTFELITSLHAINVGLLGVAENPSAATAGADLAAVPLVATEGMDIGMSEATQAGLECESLE